MGECANIKEPKPDTRQFRIAKVVRANIDAIHFIIKTDKEGTKAIFRKFLKLNDPEGLERAAKAYAMIFPVNTLPTPEGVKTLLEIWPRATQKPRPQIQDNSLM